MRWDFGSVQFSEWDADGFLGVQVDPVESGDESGAASLSELHQPYGSFSRPRDPDADGRGCSLLTMQRGSQERYAWLGSDPRTLALIPDGAKGSAYKFALTDSGELSFSEWDGETGTQSHYVPVGDSAHLVQIGVDSDGAAVLKLQHSEGMAVVMFAGGVIIHNAAGDGYLEVNAAGVTCNGNLKLNGGLDVGGSGALPLTLQPQLATAISAFNSTIQGAIPVPNDGGAAVLTALKAASAALSAAAAGMATTLTKGK